MSRLTKWIAVPVLAVAATFLADAPKANAQGFSLSIGTGGFSYGNYGVNRYGSNYGNYYNYGRRSYGPTIYPSRYYSGYRGYTSPYYRYPAPVFAPPRGPIHHHPGHHDRHRGHGRHRGR